MTITGVFIQTGKGGAERKETSPDWQPARYTGNNRYLLYTNNVPENVINTHSNVSLERHRDYDDRVDLNSFEICVRGNFDVEVEGKNINDIIEDWTTIELKNGVLLTKFLSKKIINLFDGSEVTIKVFDRSQKNTEVAVAKLVPLSENEAKDVLEKERKVEGRMFEMAISNDLM